MIVGFTGTRLGMTYAQRTQLYYVLSLLTRRTANNPRVFRHGAAKGADSEAQRVAVDEFEFTDDPYPAAKFATPRRLAPLNRS